MERKEDKSLEDLVREQGRYDVEAYRFVFESLDHLLSKLDERRHVTGAELSHAIRELALERFGFLARTVLAEWGVHRTSDFGEIVFHLVENGFMSKTKGDRKSDFDDIYDFAAAFDHAYRLPPQTKEPKKDPKK